MFVLANFIYALATVLSYLFEILKWLIIIRALLSWVNPDPYNSLVQFIERSTEPLLAPIRNLLPAWRIGLDLSPVAAIFLLYFMNLFLTRSLLDLANRLR